MKEDEAIRLKQLEQENARLKRIVALDISMLKDLSRGNQELFKTQELSREMVQSQGAGQHRHAWERYSVEALLYAAEVVRDAHRSSVRVLV